MRPLSAQRSSHTNFSTACATTGTSFSCRTGRRSLRNGALCSRSSSRRSLCGCTALSSCARSPRSSVACWPRLMLAGLRWLTISGSTYYVLAIPISTLIPNPRGCSLTGAIIMMTTYGHQATSAKDRFIQIAEIVREHAESRPGFALVDLCPPCSSALRRLVCICTHADVHLHSKTSSDVVPGRVVP